LLIPLIKNNAILLSQYIIGATIPLLLTPHIAKTVGLESYGTISILLALAAYGSTVVQYAFHITGPTMLATQQNNSTQILFSVLFSKLLLFFAVFFAVLLASAIDILPQGNNTALWLLLTILPFSSALNSTWYLYAKGKFLPVAYISILGTIFSLAVGFHMVVDESDSSFMWATISYTLTGIIIGAGSFFVSTSITPNIPTVKWKDVINSLNTGKRLFTSQLLSIAYTGSGSIIIGALAGFHEAGTYGVMERMMGAVLGGALLIHTAAYPKLVLLYSCNRISYFSLLKAVVVTYIAAVSACALFAWYFNEEILIFMYGPTGPRPYVMFALALVWVSIGIGGTALTGYFAVSHRADEVLMLTLRILIVSLLLGIPGAYLWGGTGWLGALVLSQILVLSSPMKYRNIEND
jgi:O-antigen/teichoic acid export membrane protein